MIFARKISTYQLEQSGNQATLQAQTQEQKESEAVDREIKANEAVLAGHLPTAVTNPALETAKQKVGGLERQLTRARRARNAAYEAWQCELYGAGPRCRGASNRKGRGPLAGAKAQQYRDAENLRERVERRLAVARG